MSAIRRPRQDGIVEELTREGRLSAPLLRQMQEQFDGQDWIDPGLIGRLYERELAGEKSQQRASGSFFTPDYLVDFIVKYTLEPLLSGLSVEAVCKLRIADPSCGGGAFLLGALRCLEDHCLAVGARGGPALRKRLSESCLVGVDLDPGAIEVTRAALRMAIGGRSKRPLRLSLTVGDALLPETEIGPLDAIVGNPPWGQKGLVLDAVAKARYKKLYKTARGVWDPFKLFVERCHQLLSPGGRWGLVLPDIVLLKNLQPVRDLILEGSGIEELAHCGRAFEGANIDAVAIVATRVAARVQSEHQLRVWPHLPADWSAETPSREQAQGVFRELPGHKFNLYLHGASLDLYRRLRTYPRLGDSLEMHEGVHSGNVRAKLFLPSRVNSSCQPLVLGRKELAAYQLKWGGRYLDTSPALVDREAGDYANLGRPEWHRTQKLVVRRTGDRVMAAYDTEGLYVSNNMFVLLACGDSTSLESRECLRALAAILNSRFMTWYFRAIQPRVGRLFAELKLVHLRDFPLPKPEQWRRVVGPLAALEMQARSAGAQAVANEVDLLVERAFDISPQEQEVIKVSQ